MDSLSKILQSIEEERWNVSNLTCFDDRDDNFYR